MSEFTHFDSKGRTCMVDVTNKSQTLRTAKARGIVKMAEATLKRILENDIAKGSVFETARLAGIMAAKSTSQLIPLCHPLSLGSVEIDFSPNVQQSEVEVISMVKLNGLTGAEMEALTAVSVSCLTIYDMCKAVDKEMVLSDIMLIEKTGGKSGDFKRG